MKICRWRAPHCVHPPGDLGEPIALSCHLVQPTSSMLDNAPSCNEFRSSHPVSEIELPCRLSSPLLWDHHTFVVSILGSCALFHCSAG